MTSLSRVRRGDRVKKHWRYIPNKYNKYRTHNSELGFLAHFFLRHFIQHFAGVDHLSNIPFCFFLGGKENECPADVGRDGSIDADGV